uniref:Uncharacterized protein n=1 Tax=Anguilla anguilla TaxID=7936 RepID=A0A0E9TEK4_ANGAN
MKMKQKLDTLSDFGNFYGNNFEDHCYTTQYGKVNFRLVIMSKEKLILLN